MTRLLLIGGALGCLVGASTYFGMGKTWGAPIAVTGVGVLSLGLALLSLDSSGVTRWAGMAAAASGLALVVVLVMTPDGAGTVVTGVFALFTLTLTVFAITGLISGQIPAIAAAALALGAPLLTGGVWKERLGDIGFLTTVFAALLLGVMLQERTGT